MAETAVATGRRIGVAATLRTTLEPTLALLKETAARAAKDSEFVPALFEGAFEAVLAGDTKRHDALVAEGFESEAAVIVAHSALANPSEWKPFVCVVQQCRVDAGSA